MQIAVDDFGTGYSSLSYLRKFPIDALKIDQSFVRQITTSADDTTIVTAMISMGRSLKLRVVAEGVETQEELAFLQAHHCDEAQGFISAARCLRSNSPSCSKPACPKQPPSCIGRTRCRSHRPATILGRDSRVTSGPYNTPLPPEGSRHNATVDGRKITPLFPGHSRKRPKLTAADRSRRPEVPARQRNAPSGAKSVWHRPPAGRPLKDEETSSIVFRNV